MTSTQATAPNRLYFGDNLDILRQYVDDESVDLIYLDPPFNSNATYNVLFRERSGEESAAQITAFEDTWHWGWESEIAFQDVVTQGPEKVASLLAALRQFLGQNDMMAYLTMMAQRMIELHRVLKPTGSIYLHCDPTASHYLKLLLDAVFGSVNFRNEVTWKRRHGFSSAVHQSVRFGVCTDIILFYAKTDAALFEAQYNKESPEYQAYIERYFTHVDENGRRYQATSLTNPAYRPNLIYEYKGYPPPRNGWMITKEKMEQWDREGRIHFPEKRDGRLRRKSFADELKGMPIQNLWDDIEQIGAHAQERLGYPTQKPEALLERIINASSNEGDVVLDPFCGCGTATVAAERLNRRWIGIDITHLAITLVRHRLHDSFGDALCPYEIIGQPTDSRSAAALAEQDRYQFEWWALGLVDARPANDRRRGADAGVDGYINFFDDNSGKPKRIIAQVKSGHVNRGMIATLKGDMEREKAELGVFITLQPPTEPMRQEALSAGIYTPEHFPDQQHPRVQILTIDELLAGQTVSYPRGGAPATFRQAPRRRRTQARQNNLV